MITLAVACTAAILPVGDMVTRQLDGLGVSLVPRPLSIDVTDGAFRLSDATAIVHDGSAEVEDVCRYLADVLVKETGKPLVVNRADRAARPPSSIRLTTAGAPESLGDEGYELVVALDGITLRAPTAHGLFLGVQTLRQLAESDTPAGIPCMVIYDKPQYRWRGMLLDCCRHFMTKEFVLRYIDLLAYHKMNTLHWHLTEDQGWRVEIRKYPRLTEVGAWRGPERYGGYYSQDDIREVVAYAKSRYINVVPEIEMPGHSVAALAAYPELSCTGGPFEVANRWGVFEDVYCAGNEKTFHFLRDVLDEVLQLFPSQYIHIGGDECPKARWKECPKCRERIRKEGLADEHELQSYFIKRIEKYLLSRGRRLVGWDEILEGGLAPNATVQWWRGIDDAVKAAREGHDVIASPTTHCYIDYSIDTTNLERIYSFVPTPSELTSEEAKHILGGECNMWTEHAPQDTIDSKVFPRLCGLAEALWLPPEEKSWPDFARRMTQHAERLGAMGVEVGPGMPELDKYAAPPATVARWTPEQMSEQFVEIGWDVTPHITAPGTYEVEMRYERGAHGIAIEWVRLLTGGVEVARDTHEGWSGYEKRDHAYRLTVTRLEPGRSYRLEARVRSDGGTDSAGSVRIARLKE